VDKSVDQLRKDLDKVKEQNKDEARNYITADEYRERESRRLNVIMHRVPEPQATSGEERKAADHQTCCNIFTTIGLSEWTSDIKFCRRLGERGNDPRPLIVYLKTEATRSTLLDAAKHLRNTTYADISIVPDLTPAQRQEEIALGEEMDRRNRDELTPDDVQKNLKWQLVGPRGAKRLIKSFARTSQQGGRGRGQRPSQQGGRGRPSTAAARLRAPLVPQPMGRGQQTIGPPPLLPPPPRQQNKRKRDTPAAHRTAEAENEMEEDETAEEEEDEPGTDRSPASKR
jgi:hypothetical protein